MSYRLSIGGVVTALTCLVALAAMPAKAQVVYDNGVDTPGQGGLYSDANPDYRGIAGFTLSSGITFNQVRWYGAYFSQGTVVPDNFSITLYTVTGGVVDQPGTVFTIGGGATRTSMGFNDGFGIPAYQYDAAIAPQTLGPGDYAISVFNDTTGQPIQGWVWDFTTNGGSGKQISPANDTIGQLTDPWQLDFQLINARGGATAPEPGSLALLGMAALPLVGIVRRRKA